MQEAPPLAKWLHPEICTCLRLEMCKIVALEAPSTALSRQAKVCPLDCASGHLIAVYLLTLLPYHLKLRLVLPLMWGLIPCYEGTIDGFGGRQPEVDVAFPATVG